MIGAHPFRVKGGVSGCVRNILSSDIVREYPIDYVATMVDGPWLLKLGTAVRALFIFLFKLSFSRPLLVHVHGSKEASFYRKMFFMALAKLWRKKIIFHCHSGKFDQFYHEERDWQKTLIRKVLSLSDRVVILSPHWIPFFSQLVPSSKLKVLENAVSLSFYQSKRGQFPKALEPTILFAGLLTENKGIFDLMAIVPELVKKFPSVKVLLAGSGDVQRIQAVLQSGHIEGSVQFLGWVDPQQLIGLYHQSHLFVLPSYYEGLPMVLLEAMACGLPIIATRVGGIPELVEEGENGILIHPGDREALLNAVARLLDDPILRGQMALKNVQKIKEKYDIPMYIEKLKSLYRDILREIP
jgi:glycosyltransferase involved in cell wall biosynthesis